MTWWLLVAAPLAGFVVAPLLDRLIGSVTALEAAEPDAAAPEPADTDNGDEAVVAAAVDNYPPVPYSPAAVRRRSLLLLLVLPLVFLLIALRFGESAKTAVAMAYTVWFTAIAAVDLEHRLIPNRLLFPLQALLPDKASAAWGWIMGLSSVPLFVMCALLWNISAGGMVLGLACEAGLFLLSYALTPLIFGKQGIADGDIKLAPLLGIILGFPRVLAGLFAMSVLSAVVSGFLLLSGRRGPRDYIPFAPFMVGGAAIALFVGG